ncbi:MAG TPA: acyl-CoA thioesterase [Mucilaginibacter sp.]|jgi:acyl-CoA thioester hydrolase
MDNVFYEGEVIWAQIDANQHMRHSAYADVGAQARLNMLRQAGMDPTVFLNAGIGPILFREELVYLREIALNQAIIVTSEVTRARADGSRWTIRHEIYRHDGVKAAIINVDGAWIDLQRRKLTVLTAELAAAFASAPRSADYVEEIPKAKQIN